jgi:hypothetical protein
MVFITSINLILNSVTISPAPYLETHRISPSQLSHLLNNDAYITVGLPRMFQTLNTFEYSLSASLFSGNSLTLHSLCSGQVIISGERTPTKLQYSPFLKLCISRRYSYSSLALFSSLWRFLISWLRQMCSA